MGGRRTGLRKVKAQITIVRGSPNRVTLMKFKGLLRYQKPHETDNISIYAFAYNVQYADSLYCCLYSNIRYNIQCRITNFLHCVIYYCTYFATPMISQGILRGVQTMGHCGGKDDVH